MENILDRDLHSYLEKLLDYYSSVEEIAVQKENKKEYFIKVILDRTGGITVEDLGLVTKKINEFLEQKYANLLFRLEITTRGIGAPLEKERHWYNSRGRKVKLRIKDPSSGEIYSLEGRVGELDTLGNVSIVCKNKDSFIAERLAMSTIITAKIIPDFTKPADIELELSGEAHKYEPFPKLR